MLLTAGNETGCIGIMSSLPNLGYIGYSIKNGGGESIDSAVMKITGYASKSIQPSIIVDFISNNQMNATKLNMETVNLGDYIFILETSN